MSEVPKRGRNDPCLCGSGKKYKRCCLDKARAEPAESLVWRRLRRLLEESRGDMARWVRKLYGEQSVDEAWQRFMADEKAVFDEDRDAHHLQLFLPWFYHRWSPQAGRTDVRDASLIGVVPTAEYLRRKPGLDPLLREYLESCLASPFSAFEVLQAEPGRGMCMKDLLTGEEHDVAERAASAAMQPVDVMIGQLARAGGVTLMEAAPGFSIPPIRKIDVIQLRARAFRGAITVAPEQVRTVESDVIALYRGIAKELFEPVLPKVHNTDGDALEPRQMVFDVSSPQEAFDALAHLALAESSEELLGDAERGPDGKLARVKLTWLKKGNRRMRSWENTVLGSLEVDGTRLTAEVNSAERERRLRRLIERALGGRARYRATEIQSLERVLADGPARGGAATESESLAERPEVSEQIARMMSDFYERWLKEKIPALGGRTPLQAVRDSLGRESVAALVAQIERDGARMKPPLDPAIVRRLRKRLGLDVPA